MSFWSHIGLSIVDKLTDNAFDKLGNAIKDGDVSKVVSELKSIFDGVEDKLGDITDLFEDTIDDAKKQIRNDLSKAKRRMMREARMDMQNLQDEFGDKLIEALRPTIDLIVEEEVQIRLEAMNVKED